MRTKPATRPLQWTKWLPLDGVAPLVPRVFEEILDGGQSFRWYALPPEANAPRKIYQGIWSDNVAQLTLLENNRLHWRAPRSIAKKVSAALPRYLAIETDFIAHTTTLPKRKDPRLAEAINAFGGLRVLRQPIGETLLGFICSAMKQIPQIKQMVALIAANHGTEIFPGHSEYRRLPTWVELATLSEEQLRACKLGFRARHVYRAAQLIASKPLNWLEETESLPYSAAKARLVELPGVGEKVADCVLLFGAGRLEAFPIDTWIRRVLLENYIDTTQFKTNLKYSQLLQFALDHFGAAAGLANAYYFAHARAIAKKQSRKVKASENQT